MSLSQKGQKWLDTTVKSVIALAVLGMIVLLCAVKYVEKMLTDTIGEATKTSQPASTASPHGQAPTQK